MKNIIHLVMGFLISACAHATTVDSKVALVYVGDGACEECIPAAATIATKAGLQVKKVQASQVSAALFKNAVVWIQPGGDAIDAAKSLGAKHLKEIRDFVNGGGGYLGYCAGGFMADAWVDDAHTVPGLDIIPVASYDYTPSPGGQGVHVVWGKQVRDMYFENGPSFDEVKPEDGTVLARYVDGLPAVLSTQYGKGHVIVSGPHPEAPAEWFVIDHIKRDDGLTTDEDIAIDLMKSVLPKAL